MEKFINFSKKEKDKGIFFKKFINTKMIRKLFYAFYSKKNILTLTPINLKFLKSTNKEKNRDQYESDKKLLRIINAGADKKDRIKNLSDIKQKTHVKL